ncbi:MAG: hypothetical protein GY866_37175 [Proteobacteria bacterium]|nr:hypothetical protein [Pseudomonadota bacterium]
MAYAGMSQLYAEWYALDYIGFGIRYISIATQVDYIMWGTTLSRKVSVNNSLATAQLIILGSESYARLGAIGGIGSSTYEIEYSLTTEGSDTVASNKWNTNGTATMYGLFLDWGGEDFGGRFGYNSLTTAGYDQYDGEDLDGSGAAWYFDLRWAFK